MGLSGGGGGGGQDSGISVATSVAKLDLSETDRFRGEPFKCCTR